MRTHHIITETTYHHNVPVIDGEFDRFEMNNDLMTSLCGADMANFYHDILDLEE